MERIIKFINKAIDIGMWRKSFIVPSNSCIKFRADSKFREWFIKENILSD